MLSWLDRRPKRLAAIGLLTIAGTLLPSIDARRLTTGLFRTHVARHYLRGGHVSRSLLFYRDGIASTVSVERGSDRIVLRNNGKVEASTAEDMPTQILVGVLPLLAHGSNDLSSFVVGYGSGITVGAMMQTPTLGSLDVVEIEPAIYQAADIHFSSYNHRPQTNPKVRRLVGDGRNVLLAGNKHYDIIVSEPSNPWIAGVASLFTADFYAFAKRHLAEDGIFCQWAQLYEFSPRTIKMVYRTFAEAFPYVYVFTPHHATSDTILLGSRRPLYFDLNRLAKLLTTPTLTAELQRANLHSAEELIAGLFLGPEELASFTAGAQLNTDDNAKLEFQAPRDLLANDRPFAMATAIRQPHWPYGNIIPHVLAPTAEQSARLARALIDYGRLKQARLWALRAKEQAQAPSAELDRVETLIRLCTLLPYSDPELLFTAGGPPLDAPRTQWFADNSEQGTLQIDYVLAELAKGQWRKAHQAATALPKTNPQIAGVDLAMLRGYLAYKALDYQLAKTYLETITSNPASLKRRPAALYYLGRTLFFRAEFAAGATLLAKFAREFPQICRMAVDHKKRGHQLQDQDQAVGNSP